MEDLGHRRNKQPAKRRVRSPWPHSALPIRRTIIWVDDAAPVHRAAPRKEMVAGSSGRGGSGQEGGGSSTGGRRGSVPGTGESIQQTVFHVDNFVHGSKIKRKSSSIKTDHIVILKD